MNLCKMLQMADKYTKFGNYEMAKNLAKRIEEIMTATKESPEKVSEEANCCCPFRDRAESKPTSCEVCWWQARVDLDSINARLGLS